MTGDDGAAAGKRRGSPRARGTRWLEVPIWRQPPAP